MSLASKFQLVEPEVQAQVAMEVNDRMDKAVEDLRVYKMRAYMIYGCYMGR